VCATQRFNFSNREGSHFSDILVLVVAEYVAEFGKRTLIANSSGRESRTRSNDRIAIG
jgi:hypothetical protein